MRRKGTAGTMALCTHTPLWLRRLESGATVGPAEASGELALGAVAAGDAILKESKGLKGGLLEMERGPR